MLEPLSYMCSLHSNTLFHQGKLQLRKTAFGFQEDSRVIIVAEAEVSLNTSNAFTLILKERGQATFQKHQTLWLIAASPSAQQFANPPKSSRRPRDGRDCRCR